MQPILVLPPAPPPLLPPPSPPLQPLRPLAEVKDEPAPEPGLSDKNSRVSSIATAAVAMVLSGEGSRYRNRQYSEYGEYGEYEGSVISDDEQMNTGTNIEKEQILPYIVITGLKASIDSSIDQYVKDLADRVTLKELPVNKQPGTTNNSQTKIVLADGEFPKIQVPLYEQMVFHRSSSINMNPLQLFIPTRYKINYEKIMQYFSDKATDESIVALVSGVIEEYGNHNSLFYKHTISGKSNASGLNLDDTKRKFIQAQIDKWHNDYAGWIFYDNASTFFIQNRDIPRDELITLRMELIRVFGDGTNTKGLQTLVKQTASKHLALYNLYSKNARKTISFFNITLVPYIKFFNEIFKQIKDQINDQLNFITNRKVNMGPYYDFNDTIKTTIFKTFEEMKMILDNFGDIRKVSLLNLLSVVNVFKKEIFELNKKFPLQTIFDDYILNQKKTIRSNTRNNFDTIYNVDEINEFTSDIIRKIKDEHKLEKIVEEDDEKEVAEEENVVEEEEENIEEEEAKEEEEERGEVNIFDNFYNKHIKFNNRSNVREHRVQQIKQIPFGFPPNKLDIDILFYVLYTATNNVIYDIKKKPKSFESLDVIKNLVLRSLQQRVELTERKLKNICDLIAKTGNFPVERILPDTSKYYYFNPGKKMGFVNHEKYKQEWTNILERTDGKVNSTHIIFSILQMKKKLEQSIGIYKETDLKVKHITTSLMSTLVEHNTVNVLNMLFGKPRPILYSPGLRISFLTGSSKWIFFQVDRSEIVSKRAFKQFKDRLLKVVPPKIRPSISPPPSTTEFTPLDLLLKKQTIPNDLFDMKDDLPFCIFIISSTPSPQLLAPGKDSTNDSRLENKSFKAGGDIGVNGLLVDDGSIIGALKNQLNKLGIPRKINTENCNNARTQIQKEYDDLMMTATGTLKEISVDLKKKATVDIPDKLKKATAAATAEGYGTEPPSVHSSEQSSVQSSAAATPVSYTHLTLPTKRIV